MQHQLEPGVSAGQHTGGTTPGWDLICRPPSPFLLGPASSQMLGEKEGEKLPFPPGTWTANVLLQLGVVYRPAVAGRRTPPTGNQMWLS